MALSRSVLVSVEKVDVPRKRHVLTAEGEFGKTPLLLFCSSKTARLVAENHDHNSVTTHGC